MPVPYIGITDFTDHQQVQEMLDAFTLYQQPEIPHRLHVGVMMSYKTLNGIETRWSKAMPPKEKVAGIFASRRTMNCLHYADREGIDVEANLVKAIGWGGEGITALQLDLTWPDPLEVERALDKAGKELEVILQIGSRAFEKIGDEPEALVAQIKPYRRFLNHVLLDKSGGRGIGMDAAALEPYVQAVRESFPYLGIAVAGGLGPDSVDLAEPLIQKFPDTSIDAQGRLRPSGNALDPIDWNMAGRYLIKALQLIRRAKYD